MAHLGHHSDELLNGSRCNSCDSFIVAIILWKKHLIKKFSIFLLFSKSKTLILKSPPSIIFLSFFSFLEKKSLKYFHLLLTPDLVVCKLYWNDVSRSFILNFYNKWFNVMIINAQIFVNVLTKRFINKDTELTPLWPFLILFSL